MTQKFRQSSVFRGPVKFGYNADTGSRDITIYTHTTGANFLFDMSADILIADGVDIWLKDADQLEFGDASDYVIDWETATGLQFLPAVAGNELSFGSSTLYVEGDWNMQKVDIDLYGTSPEVNINRNLTSGVTAGPVVVIKQDNAADDQAAIQVIQDASAVGLNLDGALDIDIPSAYTSGAGLAVSRNLAAGSTDNVVVLIEQSSATDDQAALQITQAASDYLALDANGWCDIGYVTGTAPSSTTVPIGAVRVYKATSNWYLAVASDGAGTFLYTAISTTSGGIS